MKKKSASQSAFFKLRCPTWRFTVLRGSQHCPAGAATNAVWPSAIPAPPPFHAQYRGVLPVVKFDISPPLRDMKPLPWKQCTLRENEDRDILAHLAPLGPVVPDPVVQRVLGKIGIPAPIISFDGNSNLCGCSPPDPNGAVGPNHVVTMANLHFQIFDKCGNSLFGPAANNTLWSGFGGPARPITLAIQSCFTTSWRTAGFLPSLPPADPPSSSVSRSHRPTIPLDRYFRYAICDRNIIFPTTRKLECGRTPTTSAPASSCQWRDILPARARMRWIASKLWPAIPIPTIVGFLAPPTPLYIVGDGLLPSDLDGQQRRLSGARTSLWVHRMTTPPMARPRMR